MTTIVIPGRPFAKQRPRATRQGRMYTPAETVAFETVVRQIAVEQFPVPITGPVKVTINAFFDPPASWSKKKRAAFVGGPHIQKPDCDNIGKAILDGLNRIAFVDDSQVWCIVAMKSWAENPETIVTVEPF